MLLGTAFGAHDIEARGAGRACYDAGGAPAADRAVDPLRQDATSHLGASASADLPCTSSDRDERVEPWRSSLAVQAMRVP